MVQALLPVGLVGLVLAGLIAALMSSLDSEICAASGLFAMDWYQPYRPAATQRRLVWAGRILSAAVVVIGVFWAIVVIPQFRFLYEYLAKFSSYIPGTIVACFLWGMVSKRPTRKGAFATLIAGSIFGVFLWLVNDSAVLNRLVCGEEGLGLAFLEMHFLHAAFVIFAVASALLFRFQLCVWRRGAGTLGARRRDADADPEAGSGLLAGSGGIAGGVLRGVLVFLLGCRMTANLTRQDNGTASCRASERSVVQGAGHFPHLRGVGETRVRNSRRSS